MDWEGATIGGVAVLAAAWLWYHQQAARATAMLGLLGGIGLAGTAGAFLAQSITSLAGAIGEPIGPSIATALSAVLSGLATAAALEAAINGIFTRTAEPRRFHLPAAALAPILVVAGGMPGIGELLGGPSTAPTALQLAAVAIMGAGWLWIHRHAPKTTNFLGLLGGVGLAGTVGALLGQALTALAKGPVHAALGIGTSALIAGAAVLGTLEVLLKGIFPRTAKPRRGHLPMAILLPTLIIAGGVPGLSQLVGNASSNLPGAVSAASNALVLSPATAGGGTELGPAVTPTDGAAPAGAPPVEQAAAAETQQDIAPSAAPAAAPAAVSTNASICTSDGQPIVEVAGLRDHRLGYAWTIIATGKSMGVPERGQIIANATVAQEASYLMHANSTVPDSLNFPHDKVGKDHDSLGLYQQRGKGWGSMAERMDPAASSKMFYAALLKVPDWQKLSVTEAAQKVQISAHPDAYAKHEPLATELVRVLGAAVECASLQPAGA